MQRFLLTILLLLAAHLGLRAQVLTSDLPLDDSLQRLVLSLQRPAQLHDTSDIVLPLGLSVAARDYFGIADGDEPSLAKERAFFGDSVSGSGFVSQAVSSGSQKDMSQNTLADISVSTTLANGVEVSAQLRDYNMPVADDGSTSQVSELSSVMISLKKDSTVFSAGDIVVEGSDCSLIAFSKKIKGFDFRTVNRVGECDTLSLRADFAATKGKSRRQEFFGRDNSQGPYYLTAESSSASVIVLIGSERVFLDGKLLASGDDADYVIDYNAGTIEFSLCHVITAQSRIVVDFEYSESLYSNFFVYADAAFSAPRSSFSVGYLSEFDALGSAGNLSDAALSAMADSSSRCGAVLVGDTAFACPKIKNYLVLGVSNRPAGNTELMFQAVAEGARLNRISSEGSADRSLACIMGASRSFLSADTLRDLRLSFGAKCLSENFSPLVTDKDVGFFQRWNLRSYSPGRREAYTNLAVSYTDSSSSAACKVELADIDGMMRGAGGELCLSDCRRLVKSDLRAEYYRSRQGGLVGQYSSLGINAELRLNPFVIGASLMERGNALGSDSDSASLCFRDISAFVRMRGVTLSATDRRTFSDFALSDRFGSQRFVSLDADIAKSSGFRIRMLEILKSTRTYGNAAHSPSDNLNSLTGRLDASLATLRKMLTISASQQSDCGTEEQMAYKYMKTAPGCGYFVWNDYNGDGIEDISEFEKSFYKSDADYVKYFVHTGKYVNTLHRRLSASLSFSGRADSSKLAWLYSRMSLNASYSLSSKQSISGGSAFATGDSLILRQLQQSYASRLLTVSNLWIGNSYSSSSANRLTYYGLEGSSSRTSSYYIEALLALCRINYQLSKGLTEYMSEFFDDKNYSIHATDHKIDLKLELPGGLQPEAWYQNTVSLTPQSLVHRHTAALQLAYSDEKHGSASLTVKYIHNRLTGSDSSPVVYQLLEGLAAGSSLVADMTASYKLARHLMLTLSYSLRRTSRLRPLHFGELELKVVM